MNQVITAVCARCCTRVDASELDNPEKKCDVCRGIQPIANSVPGDSATCAAIEDLHAGGHALLDVREFDGGAHLAECDEL